VKACKGCYFYSHQSTRKKLTSTHSRALDAQNSASDNVKAGEKLNDDPNNKELSSDTISKAGDAKSDAGKARKETRRLDDLDKNIANKMHILPAPHVRIAFHSGSFGNNC